MRRCRPLLGTFVEITADDAAAIDAAFAEVDRVHRLMSAHEPDSELSLINRFAHLRPVAVSAATAEVIERALHWSRASDGAFDVVRAGGQAIERGALPLHHDQPWPNPSSNWQSVRIADRAVILDQPACLDLGGIAKGYAVDCAIAALRSAGVPRGLVNAGGDMRGFGPDPWSVAVPNPLDRQTVATTDLTDSALATSAGLMARRHALSFDHLPGAHRNWISVTVRAGIACDADALTKIVWANAPALVDILAGANADAFAVRSDGAIRAIAAEAQAA
ncbi:MAG: FAD:protein FMN transferase [Sphingomicrobium sp.]